MRKLLSDGANSIAHVAFGLATYSFPVILPFYIVYQLKDIDEDTPVDFMEYFLGSVIAVYVLKNKN
jgi:hypothetical protein